MMADTGKRKPVETGVFRLDSKDQVKGEPKSRESSIRFLSKRGVRLPSPDQTLAQTIGRKYNITMPKKSEHAHLYKPEDGAHFLVAVLTKLSRSTYTWAEPIED
jgi:hypothetical protein